jgi:hypothetical protein
MGEHQVDPARRLPGLRRVVAAGPGHLVMLAGDQRHVRRHRLRRCPPGPHHVRVHQIRRREPWAKPAGKHRLRRPLQAPRTHQFAHPERLGGKAVAGGQRQPRRRRVAGQHGSHDSLPAQGSRQPQRRQLRPAGLQHAQHPNHPHPAAPSPVTSSRSPATALPGTAAARPAAPQALKPTMTAPGSSFKRLRVIRAMVAAAPAWWFRGCRPWPGVLLPSWPKPAASRRPARSRMPSRRTATGRLPDGSQPGAADASCLPRAGPLGTPRRRPGRS